MMTEFWWFFDALVLLIVGGIVISNAKKGLTKVFIICIGYLVATIVATFCSGAAADALYEVTARPSNIDSIQEINASFDVAQCFMDAIDERNYGAILSKQSIEDMLAAPNTVKFDSNLLSYVNRLTGYEVCSQVEFKQILTDAFIEDYGGALSEKLPSYVPANLKQQMSENPALINTLLEKFYQPDVVSDDSVEEENAEFVEDHFGAEPSTECFRIFIYIIFFSVVMMIAGITSSAMKYRLFFNVRSGTEHFLGAMLGFIEAAAILIILTMLVRLCILIGGGEFLIFNDDVIQKSHIYKIIYTQLDILM